MYVRPKLTFVSFFLCFFFFEPFPYKLLAIIQSHSIPVIKMDQTDQAKIWKQTQCPPSPGVQKRSPGAKAGIRYHICRKLVSLAPKYGEVKKVAERERQRS